MTDAPICGKRVDRAPATSPTIARPNAVAALFVVLLFVTSANAQSRPHPEQARLREVVQLLASPEFGMSDWKAALRLIEGKGSDWRQ